METNDKPTSIVQIDELNLDKECIRLPTDVLKWAYRVADLRNDLDSAKAEMEIQEAQCSKWIRENPEKYGLEKATENGVKAAIQLHPKYKEAEGKWRGMKHELELAQAVVQALEVKKRSLTLLVDLHGMGYFADVKPTKEGKEAVERMTKRAVRRFKDDD